MFYLNPHCTVCTCPNVSESNCNAVMYDGNANAIAMGRDGSANATQWSVTCHDDHRLKNGEKNKLLRCLDMEWDHNDFECISKLFHVLVN